MLEWKLALFDFIILKLALVLCEIILEVFMTKFMLFQYAEGDCVKIAAEFQEYWLF